MIRSSYYPAMSDTVAAKPRGAAAPAPDSVLNRSWEKMSALARFANPPQREVRSGENDNLAVTQCAYPVTVFDME